MLGLEDVAVSMGWRGKGARGGRFAENSVRWEDVEAFGHVSERHGSSSKT